MNMLQFELFASVARTQNISRTAEQYSVSQPAVSHQLKVLKQNRLVKNRREGKTIYYSLADRHVQGIITQGYEHVTEETEDETAK